MSRDGKRRRGLTQDERVLWTVVTKAITPLRERPPIASDDDGEAATNSPKATKKAMKPALRLAKTAPAVARPVPPKAAAPPLAPLSPLGRRMKQRVARGKQAIDARLDLHGLTQSEAHGELLRFLRNANARDARLVLVITGKGRGGEPGVLRRQVPQWLSLPEFRSYVVGFEDAHIAHGGEGALYVRVRRARGGSDDLR
jgi:DNA-nicking Smr family endonuclease